MQSVEERKDSRGAHTHEDHPSRIDNKCTKHTLAYFDKKEGKTRVGYRPIQSYRLNEEDFKTVRWW